MGHAILPLPTLTIGALTAKSFDQSSADRLLNIIYHERPDFYTRMAKREQTEANPYDEFAMEFRAYLIDIISREFSQSRSKAWTEIYREARRRARLMYGMHI